MPLVYHDINSNGFPIEQQLMSNWCWAACTVSVCSYYQRNPQFSQGGLVAQMFDMPICDSRRPFPPCNKSLDFGTALHHVGHLDGESVDQPLPPQTLFASLHAHRPVGCQMFIPGVGGHATVVVDAFWTPSNALIVRVADPADGSIVTMPFTIFRNNYRGIGGRWTRSYFTKPQNQI